MSSPIVPASQELDEILGIGHAIAPEEEIDKLASELISVRSQIEQLKLREQAIEDSIWTRTPDQPGEAVVDGKQLSFLVTRSEKWSWDSDKIATKIVTVPVPEHIKVKYSVDKKKYLALPAQDQHDLLDALERGPGKPSVKVFNKS